MDTARDTKKEPLASCVITAPLRSLRELWGTPSLVVYDYLFLTMKVAEPPAAHLIGDERRVDLGGLEPPTSAMRMRCSAR